jgi:hypothetical protein
MRTKENTHFEPAQLLTSTCEKKLPETELVMKGRSSISQILQSPLETAGHLVRCEWVSTYFPYFFFR